MALEVVGLRAVFEGLSNYLRSTGAATRATEQLERAQLSAQRTSITTTAAIQRANANVAAAEAKVGEVRRRTALQLQNAQRAIERERTDAARRSTLANQRLLAADARVAAAATQSTERQASAARGQILAREAVARAAEINLRKIGDAERRLTNVTQSAIAQRAAAGRALVGARGAQAATAGAAAITNQLAQGRVAGLTTGLAGLFAPGSIAARAYTAAVTGANRVSRTFGQLLIAMTGYANRFAVAMRFGVAAIGAFGTAIAVGAASKFETQLVKIDNLTELTTFQTKELGKEILNMTKTLPQTPDELGAGAYFILSSGITDVVQAQNLLEQSAKASTIGMGTTAEVARAATAVVNAYGAANISGSQAIDIMARAAQLGSADASDFAGEIGRLVPIASTMGITFDQVAAALAGLTNVGLPAHQAASALLGIMNQLFSPAEGAKEALEGVGTSIEQVRANIRDKGLIIALQDLLAAFGNNVQAIEELFPEVRGLGGALALLRNNGADNARILDGVRHSVGFVDDAFQRANKTFAVQVGLLRNALMRVLIALGTAILPTLTRAVAGLTAWLNKNQKAIVDTVVFGWNILINAVKLAWQAFMIFIAPVKAVIQVLTQIIGASAAAKVALAGIAFGLSWALPGGPYIAGLLIISGLLSQIAGQAGGKVRGRDFLTDKLAKVEIGGVKPFRGVGGIFNQIREVAGVGITPQQEQQRITEQAMKLEEERLRQLGEQAQFADQNLAKLPATFNDVALGGDEASEAADKAAEALKQLAQEFESSSKAAGQVTSLTAEMGLFGSVSRELADAMGLSAEAAGNVQGYDAFIQAANRADNEAYDFARTMATVAQAFTHSANVAQRIVLSLARSALSASQAAVGAVFGRPTREVAGLELQLAQANLQELQIRRALEPQIAALEAQLDRLRKVNEAQIDAIDDQIKNINRLEEQRVEALRDQLENLREAQEAQIDAIKDQADALKEHAKEAARQQKIVDDEIDALLEFLDYADLTNAQRKAVEDNIKALQAQRAELIKSQINAEKQSDALEKQADDLKDAADKQIEAIENQIDAVQDATEAQVEALEAQKEALEDSTAAQESAIQDQIDSLEAQIKTYTDNTEAIQHQIDLYAAHAEILQKEIQLADQTLLTEEEQLRLARELQAQIAEESRVVRELSSALGLELLPEVDEARHLFDAMNHALGIITNQTLLGNFLSGVDVAAERARILAAALWEAADGGNGAAGGLGAAGGAGWDLANALDHARHGLNDFQYHMDLTIYELSRLSQGISNAASGYGVPGAGTQYGSFQHGGMIWGPMSARLGEGGAPEVVLPLTRPQEMREVIATIPPSLMMNLRNAISNPGGGGVSVSVDTMNITDPRRNTGPVGDLAYSLNRALYERGFR